MTEPQAKPQSSKQTQGYQSSQIKETVTWLSHILQDETERKALFKLRGSRAQQLIDSLNYLISNPEFRRRAEPWLLKHTAIALRRLCEAAMLYPTCYVLSGIQNISSKSGGGFCDISQGHYGDKLICLKVVRLYQDSNIERLLKAHAREAILWSQLDHPNILPFYGIFYLRRKERICLVSPWMENGDVVEYLQRVPGAPRESLVNDITNGLHYLHAENIVHGDLKGRNILIDDHGSACLVDFGLSTIVTNETLGFARTTVGSSGYTIRWASPELLEENARPTRASDVWAFGCVCYEVLTGIEPFAGCSDIRVLAKLMRGELPAQLDNAQPDVNKNLDGSHRNLIRRCWSTEAKERPECPEILRELGLGSYKPQQRHHSSSNRLTVPVPATDLNASNKLLKQLYYGYEKSPIKAATESPPRRRRPEGSSPSHQPSYHPAAPQGLARPPSPHFPPAVVVPPDNDTLRVHLPPLPLPPQLPPLPLSRPPVVIPPPLPPSQPSFVTIRPPSPDFWPVSVVIPPPLAPSESEPSFVPIRPPSPYFRPVPVVIPIPPDNDTFRADSHRVKLGTKSDGPSPNRYRGNQGGTRPSAGKTASAERDLGFFDTLWDRLRRRR